MSDKIVRILLIEDNPGDACSIRQALTDATLANPSAPSFDLTRAQRLSSGLKRLARGGFDVLLLDFSLPDSQGLDTFVKTYAQAAGIPIIVLSGLEDREMALAAVQKGTQDLVKDEMSGSLLVRAIRYAVERKQAEEALRESEERYRSVSELISDFAYTVRVELDGSFVIEWATAAFARITGFTVEETWARGGWQTLLHPEGLPAIVKFGQCLLSDESGVSDFRIITNDKNAFRPSERGEYYVRQQLYSEQNPKWMDPPRCWGRCDGFACHNRPAVDRLWRRVENQNLHHRRA